MNSFKTLTNQNLVLKLRAMIAEERKVTLQILHLINEAHSRRLYAEDGYPSLFEWLTKSLGYSAAAAMRRIESARALREVPALEKKIETGELNLTNLAKVQAVIRAEEKRTGERLSLGKRTETFSLIELKSSREAELILVTAFPEAARSAAAISGNAKAESVRPISETEVRVQVTLTRQQLEKLNRVRDVASHSHFGASLSGIIDMLASSYLEKNDPLLREVKPRPRKSSAPANLSDATSSDATSSDATSLPSAEIAASSLPAPEVTSPEVMPQKVEVHRRPIAPSLKNAVLRSAHGQCQFVDHRTGHRCDSRSLLEIDHIVPVSLGGTNEPRNLRVLCRTHNLLAAERILGKKLLQAFVNRQ